MSAVTYGRKRRFIPARDSSGSESEDEAPIKKIRKSEGDLPVLFRDKLSRFKDWIVSLKDLNHFTRMAYILKWADVAEECDKPYEEEEDCKVDDNAIEEINDDDIQEIKETSHKLNRKKMSSLVKDFRKSLISSDSGQSKSPEVNGSFMPIARYRPPKFNGITELSTTCHGTTLCKLRREQTEKLKRRPLISNPATEVEIIVGNDPEVVTLEEEEDDVEVVAESPRSKQSAEKKLHSSLNSACPKISALKHNPRSYTANTVIRLQEKAQYKLLLEKYANKPPYEYLCKKPQPDKGVKEDSYSKIPTFRRPLDDFVESYYAQRGLLSSKKASEKEKPPPETVTLDDDEEEEDEEVKLIEIKLPKYKAIFRTKLGTQEWLAELGQHLKSQMQERKKIVEAYERQLDECRKKRILRQISYGIEAPPEEFPELTPEMEAEIENVLNTGDPEDFICQSVDGEKILRKDFETLTGLHWLNDRIIKAYIELIVDRSKKVEGLPSLHYFDTFFYDSIKNNGYDRVRRWTRKIDFFSFDIVIIPIHLAYHWCLAIIDHRAKTIRYYDSMGTSNEDCLELLNDYMISEAKDKKKINLDPNLYSKETMKNIPQQMNGSDCGMFCIKYAEYISRDAEITFNQQHMAYFRRRAIYEILKQQLL